MGQDLRRTVLKLIDPLRRRVYLMLSRAVISLVDDAAGRQYTQLTALSNEVKDQVERLQQYGLTSVPLPGAQGLIVCIGGNRDHALVLSADDPRFRKHGLQPGEVALYDHLGNYVLLRQDNVMEISAPEILLKASTKVRMETPLLEVTGDIVDLCDSIGESMDGMRQIYNIHTHDENDVEGPTDIPNQLMNP